MTSTATDPTTRLAALAVGLCQDAAIGLEVAERGWAWDPVRRVIIVGGNDLKSKGPDYCAGVLAHEVGHYFISRYVWFAVPFPSQSLLMFFLNAIEDPRVNTWIRRRYPGTDLWMHQVSLADAYQGSDVILPDFLTFAFACAREEWLGWRPATSVTRLPDRVARALEQSRPARRRFATTLPPADLDPEPYGPDLTERYRRDVWPRLSHAAPLSQPSPWEQAVRVEVLESLRVAEEEIFPVVLGLLEGDIHRLASLIRSDAVVRAAAREVVREPDPRRLLAIFARAAEHAPDPKAADNPALRQLGLELIEAWLAHWRGQCGQSCREPMLGPGRPRPGVPRQGRPGRPISGRRLPPLQLPAPSTAYDRTLINIAPQIDLLTRHIEEALLPRKRLREGRDFPSGHKLNLRRVMAYQADPRLYNKLWLRKTIPDRRSAAVSLLVDLSGSMRGDKCDAAVAGTILLAEALHRLAVPFAINGFQDVLIPVCDFADGLTPQVRRAIAEMAQEVDGSRSGGNNTPLYNDDGLCLLEAAEGLLDRSETDRVLLVVSDGIPEGRRSTEDDLHKAVAQLRGLRPALTLIGLGLGPGTDHVNKFYPESIANIPVERFAEEIGRVLQRTLLDRHR